MNTGQLDLDWSASTPNELDGAPSGLRLITEVMDSSFETDMLTVIDRQPWSAALSRRVQHFGWRYDYKSRRVQRDDYLGELPAFLAPLVEVVERHAGMRPDQAIINEYLPGQGIARHIDCEPCFGPVVAMIGLGSDTQMDFFDGDSKVEWALAFRRRSMLIVSGDARSQWAHSIAKRRSDPAFGIHRKRRLSVTFRTVVQSA